MTRITDSSQEPFTHRMIIRAFVKALCLFAVFNIGYGILQPSQNGLLPSLYNIIFPGRERFQKGYEFDPYRLLSDHIVSRAQAESFNILILGSSEIWGSRTSAAESIPAYLDASGLRAADGRPVRVYNLGYPFPYAFKDLVILEAAVQQHIPIDLAIVSTFDTSLSLTYFPHTVSSANLSLEKYVIKHYHFPVKYFDPKSVTTQDFASVFLSVWNDRDALLAWSSMQMRGLSWSLLRDDVDNTNVLLRYFPSSMKSFLETLTLDRMQPEDTMLSAIAQFHRETQIPVLILNAPVPVATNEFAPWLQEQTQALGLPLLDCWDVFHDPYRFEDYHHITSETHALYASILAKGLSDAAFAAIPGLPLQLNSNVVLPSETCTTYP